MIEKLKTLEDDEIDMSVGAVNTRFADTELVRKINELVDAVNELTSCVGQLGVEFTDPKANTVYVDKECYMSDPYAKQRKWLEPVVRFVDMPERKIKRNIALMQSRVKCIKKPEQKE